MGIHAQPFLDDPQVAQALAPLPGELLITPPDFLGCRGLQFATFMGACVEDMQLVLLGPKRIYGRYYQAGRYHVPVGLELLPGFDGDDLRLLLRSMFGRRARGLASAATDICLQKCEQAYLIPYGPWEYWRKGGVAEALEAFFAPRLGRPLPMDEVRRHVIRCDFRLYEAIARHRLREQAPLLHWRIDALRQCQEAFEKRWGGR